MNKRKEAFKKMHPEQFSDSKDIRKATLNRDFLDFYFETLTSKNLEKEFEAFCRHIAEVEICPNLLPQTGPTGGGDSKVDSETYPVSESIAELWYYGNGNKAATERWAFAISAKKDWKSKIKSDVRKIAKVNSDEKRGYTTIFFMSNQYISDKKRADTEDELRNECNLDVRILDRTWLLDKSLKNTKNIEIAIKSFNLSDSFSDEKHIGEKDYKRTQELEEIENLLKEKNLKATQILEISQRSVVLARELEFTKQEMLNLIERNCRIAKEYGSVVNIADSIYNAAWTIYWWYDDGALYYKYYREYEKIVFEEHNVNLFRNLVTLWMNLYSLSFDYKHISLDNHTDQLKNEYGILTSDLSKPNRTIEAKAAYQLMRVFLGDTPNDIVDDMIQIVNDSFGHLDLDLYPISHAVQEISILEEADHYDELFESIVAIMSEQKQKSESAVMLAKRGYSLSEKKPYEALAFFSRALMGLYNESNKDYLTMVIMNMGYIFERIGLLWAARNFYYYDFCLCLNQYMKYGEVNLGLVESAHALKYIELRLGRVLYAVEFESLANISEHLFPKEIKHKDEETYNFDFVLAVQILRTHYDVEKSLGQLPAYLEKQGLTFSSAAMKYELGYYDEDLLTELNNSEEVFDDLIEKMNTNPVSKQLKFSPWYGVESSCMLKTNLLGCSIELEINGDTKYEHGDIEIGATILATVESFFGTGITNELISLTGKIRIGLCYKADCKEFIKCKMHDEESNLISVVFKDYDSADIVKSQQEFSGFVIDIIGMIISIMFPCDSELKKIEKMIKNDAAFERSQTFVNSIFYGMNTFGKDMFCFKNIMRDFESMQMKRSVKSEQTDVKIEENKIKNISPEAIYYDKPPKDINFKNVSNENIITSSIINVPLWNSCDWKGLVFLSSPSHDFPPIISFAFTKLSCQKIFEEWIKDIGRNDINHKIGIRIIKGINKEHPYWYRVAIGQLKLPRNDIGEEQIIAMPIRMHTMQAENDVNIKMFEQELNNAKSFIICPSHLADISERPNIFNNLQIHKGLESIVICDACDVQENDWLTEGAILSTDNPIIPKGRENAEIVKIIKRKQQYIYH